MNKTTLSKQEAHDWVLVDAAGQTLGRFATQIARRLMGKHKPTYTPHVDNGDHVVIINAEKIVVSGNKAETKVYHHYTGWRSGLKETTYEKMMNEHPERILELAIRRMMPKGPLGKRMMNKLHVYAGEGHPHTAQKPQPLNLEGASA